MVAFRRELQKRVAHVLAPALVALAGLDAPIWAALILALIGIGAGAVQPERLKTMLEGVQA